MRRLLAALMSGVALLFWSPATQVGPESSKTGTRGPENRGPEAPAVPVGLWVCFSPSQFCALTALSQAGTWLSLSCPHAPAFRHAQAARSEPSASDPCSPSGGKQHGHARPQEGKGQPSGAEGILFPPFRRASRSSAARRSWHGGPTLRAKPGALLLNLYTR